MATESLCQIKVKLSMFPYTQVYQVRYKDLCPYSPPIVDLPFLLTLLVDTELTVKVKVLTCSFLRRYTNRQDTRNNIAASVETVLNALHVRSAILRCTVCTMSLHFSY